MGCLRSACSDQIPHQPSRTRKTAAADAAIARSGFGAFLGQRPVRASGGGGDLVVRLSMHSHRDRFDEPFELPLHDFLTGGEHRELLVDQLFGRTFDDLIRDFLCVTFICGPSRNAVSVSDHFFLQVETEQDRGVLLFSQRYEIVGAYVGPALAIKEDRQGFGLGAELVYEFAHSFGVLPTWFLDTPSYSPAGLAAHSRAWSFGRSRRFISAKLSLPPGPPLADHKQNWRISQLQRAGYKNPLDTCYQLAKSPN